MEKHELEIEGAYLLDNFCASDDRGSFTKMYNAEEMKSLGLSWEFEESYYSLSKKNTIRGMHFQLPPYDHVKMTHLLRGKAIDVILDLRKDSKTYKKYITIEMDEEKKQAVYIPKGCAHGFKALEDNTIMLYYVTSGHEKNSDAGILYSSFGFNWNCAEPIMSVRDQQFCSLDDFVSPF